MRKTVTFTAQTLEIADRIATTDSYRSALIEAAGEEAGEAATGSESARLRQLAEIGAAVVARSAEDAGYHKLAQIYADEGSVYKSFQDPALARRPREAEDEEALDRLFDGLAAQ